MRPMRFLTNCAVVCILRGSWEWDKLVSGPLTSSVTVLAAKLRSKTRGHKPPTVFLNIGHMANLLLFTYWSLIAETWEKITLKDTDEMKSSTYKAKCSVKCETLSRCLDHFLVVRCLHLQTLFIHQNKYLDLVRTFYWSADICIPELLL